MEENYKGHILKGSTLRGRPEVAVFLGRERLIIVDGATLEEARLKGRAFIDSQREGEAKERRSSRVATTQEYIRYFKANPPRQHEEKMLRANAARPLTATELAAAAGWDSYEGANAQYGALGAEVGRTIGLEFDRYKDGSEFFMSVLVRELEQKDPESGHMLFEMHPELVEALKGLGLA